MIAESDIRAKPAGDAQSRAARRLLRHEQRPTSETAEAIESAVGQQNAACNHAVGPECDKHPRRPPPYTEARDPSLNCAVGTMP